jgi:predicted esterase
MNLKLRWMLLVLGVVLAADARTWTSVSGKQIEAEFVSETFGQVTLKTPQGEKIGIPLAKLCPEDREFIQARKIPASRTRSTAAAVEESRAAALAPRHGTPEVAAKMTPGATFVQTAAGLNAITYHVRVPPGYDPARPTPLVIAFSSTGNGHSILRSISASTDKAGWIAIGCDKLRNNLEDDKLTDAMEDEVLEDIYRSIPHDPRRVYLAGHSGGAMRAYGITARREDPFAGILAYGGWLGGPEHQKKRYCRFMAVAMINGDKDDAANSWAVSDKQALLLRKCNVEIFTFPGGHPMPSDPEVSDRAIAWLRQEWEAKAR